MRRRTENKIRHNSNVAKWKSRKKNKMQSNDDNTIYAQEARRIANNLLTLADGIEKKQKKLVKTEFRRAGKVLCDMGRKNQ